MTLNPIMVVTPLYACVLAVIFTGLSLRVIAGRRRSKVALGDGGDADLLRRQRVHANFSEYAPLVLILMALAELQSAPSWTLHEIGSLFLVGRLLHAAGVSQQRERFWQRVTGMILTFSAILLAVMVNISVNTLVTTFIG